VKPTLSEAQFACWQPDPNQICVPSEHDVLCGRGLVAFRHVGNERLRVLIAQTLPLFATTTCKHEKTRLVRSLVKKVLDRGGRFLKRFPKSNVWYLAGFNSAREKVSHALRDAASNKVKCMRGLALSRKSDDISTVPSEDKTLLEDTTIQVPENESALKATETLRTAPLPTKSGTDDLCNHFNLDSMAMLDMMRVALFATKDVAVTRSTEILELLTASVDTPEWFVPPRDTNFQEDAANFNLSTVDIAECLDVFNELSCADLGWT
jgi:hypothetical protein